MTTGSSVGYGDDEAQSKIRIKKAVVSSQVETSIVFMKIYDSNPGVGIAFTG